MGLFSGRAPGSVDLRARDYVLTGCPLVAQDDQLVLVDATVRLAVRRPTEGEDLVLGYDPAQETAIHAVLVVVLRLLARSVPYDELLVGRALVTEALEQGFAFAPVGAGIDARVLSVEVRGYARDPAIFEHEFRIANP